MVSSEPACVLAHVAEEPRSLLAGRRAEQLDRPTDVADDDVPGARARQEGVHVPGQGAGPREDPNGSGSAIDLG